MPENTPIYSAVNKYIQENNIRLHMPGHIGRGMPGKQFKEISLLDVTEVPGLDDLHLPLEVIEAARNLLARAFGASESFFLVNGATSGIQALFMGLSSEQQKVLVPRNAHRSFYAGMVLSGAMPIYIPVQVEKELGITLSVTPRDIESLISATQSDGAIFITSPSYYGTTCFVDKIADVARRYNKILAVDEAHGAHFPFNKLYPTPALQAGADASVNGLHKTLPVLNQGACMHIANTLVNNQKIKAAYSLLTTTSPSYPILASIDLARYFMEEHGAKLLGQARELSREFRIKINQIKGFKCYGEELKFIAGVNEIDPLKLLISVKDTGLTGYQVAKLLRQNYKIQIELAETNLIMAMVSIFHEREDWERLHKALKDITERYSGTIRRDFTAQLPPYPQVVLSPRQAFRGGKRKVLLKDSLNMIAGEMVAAYPPGIPGVLPGELITPPVWEYLTYLKAIGAHLQGPQDHTLEYIMVLEG